MPNVLFDDPRAQALREPREKPDAKRLVEMLRGDIHDWYTLGLFTDLQRAHRTRTCWWTQKQWDGTMAEQPYGTKQTFPWKGAPDHEARVVDQLCNEEMEVAMLAWFMGEKTVRPRDVMDDDGARKAVAWKWVLDFELDQSERDRTDALELLWNCVAELGYGVWLERWVQQWRVGRKTLSLSDFIASMVREGAQMAAEAAVPFGDEEADMIAGEVMLRLYDPDMTDDLVERLRAFDPLMPEDEARKVLAEWRKGNTDDTPYYAPIEEPGLSKPRALIPGVDVIFPALTQNLRDTRFWVFEWITEAEVRIRAAAEKWDTDWTEQLLKTPGLVVEWSQLGIGSYSGWELNGVDLMTQLNLHTLRNAGMYQVANLWQFGVSKAGLPAPYRTLLHGQIPGYGLHECDPAGTGRMPVLMVRREAKRNIVAASRGISTEMVTHQLVEKQLIDAVSAQAQLRAAPPFLDTMDGGADGLKPFARLAVSSRMLTQGARPGFMEVPDVSPEVIQFLGKLEERRNDFYCRGPNADPDARRARRMRQLNRACGFYKEMLLLLCLNVQSDTDELRLGSVNGVAVNQIITADDLEGELDVTVKCDIAAADLELAEKKIQMIIQVLSLDRNGTADMNRVFRVLMGWIDSNIFTTGIMDLKQATEREKAEIDAIISKVVAGIIVMDDELAKPAGNPSLRIDQINQWMSLAENQQIMAQRPMVAEQLQKLIQHYQFQIDQYQKNAAIGRVSGVNPELKTAVPALPAAAPAIPGMMNQAA